MAIVYALSKRGRVDQRCPLPIHNDREVLTQETKRCTKPKRIHPKSGKRKTEELNLNGFVCTKELRITLVTLRPRLEGSGTIRHRGDPSHGSGEAVGISFPE
ncbi:hypothetical protein SKAU_G00373970 [Synaphobranchus kaupii]|uniref:Uncharacterized protein n=1 Tax=Synaphobranchus kaupii TaxID=118154 RepID=A0A9Q1IG86_SYNKA|nr:hypothetical protein SKAU_G00373970 [Synaphobranchus kaupii]